MSDTNAKPITFADITRIGQRRVDETRIVEIPSLGGTVKLRQLSGADQDAAVTAGHASGTFDAHAVAREQIKRSMVEPALPEAEADEILDNLPVRAFGELQSVVQANSGLLPGQGVEDLVKSFRIAAIASGADADGGADAHDAADDDGVGSTDTVAADGVEGAAPLAGDGAGPGGEAAGEAVDAAVEDEGVTA